MIGATQGRMAIDQTEHTASRAVVLKKKIETHTHTHKKRRKKERKKERKTEEDEPANQQRRRPKRGLVSQGTTLGWNCAALAMTRPKVGTPHAKAEYGMNRRLSGIFIDDLLTHTHTHTHACCKNDSNGRITPFSNLT